MSALVEQETVLTVGRGDDVAQVYTNEPHVLRRLRALAASSDYVAEKRGGDDWGEFTVRSENFKPLLAIRAPRVRSEAQVAAARAQGARLAASRAKAVPA